MKRFRKFTIILLSMAMMLSLLPLSVFADETASNQITAFDGTSVRVAVSDVTAILFTAAYEQTGSLKSVEMFKFDKSGEHIFTLKNKADKAMLWSKDMKPYDCKKAQEIVSTPTPTISPTTNTTENPTTVPKPTAIPKSSEIVFDRTTYPLYVGNSSVSDFSKWDGYGSDFTLNASVNSEQYSASDIQWTVSDDNIVSISISSDKTNAKIKGRRTGIATVTATLPNDETANCYVTVIDNASRLTVNRLELNADKLTLAPSSTAELKPIFYPKDIYNLGMLNTSLKWESSDASVATVTNDGIVTAAKSGTATITATSEDVGRTAQCVVTVNNIPAASITANQTETVNMTVGENTTLTAETDSEVIWQSDNSYIADVDENGVVTAYSNSNVQNVSADGLTVTETAGTVKIYATAVNGGKRAEYEICVANSDIADEYLKASDGVFGKSGYTATTKTSNLSISAKDIDVDEVYQIIPEADGDSKLLWICSSLNTASVDREGNVQGYKPGTVKIHAVAEDSLTDEQISKVKELQSNRELGESAELSAILENAVYAECELTVKNSSLYLRNLHIAEETITDNSVNLLWNRAALNHIPDFKEYKVYVNGEETAVTTALGYTVNNLDASSEYTFKVSAINTSGAEVISETVTATTKPLPAKVLNVLDYGAKGNGKVLDTYAIQKAINDCPENGMVYLPAGYVFYSGALFLKSNMTFKVDGIIMGSIDPKDYPRWVTKWEGWRKTEQSASDWANTTSGLPENHMPHSSLINAGKYDEGVWGMTGPYNVENLVICGDGQINANGFSLGFNEGPNATYKSEPWTSYEYPVKDPTSRGRAITIHNGNNIYVKDITAAYSPSWSVHTINCNNITFDNMDVITQGNGNTGKGTTVKTCGHIPNGDGIDPESCTNVNIFNVEFSTGDDAVAMKSGRNKEGNQYSKPNAYVRITDCISTWSLGGFGTGSENAGGAHDLLFQNIKAENIRMYGIWLKTTEARGGITENVQIRDMSVKDANSAVFMDHEYVSSKTNPADEKPVLRYVTLENVTSEGTSNGIKVAGKSNCPINNVSILNLKCKTEMPSELKYCSDFYILDAENATWLQNNTSNISILTTEMLEDTQLSIKDGAYKIKEIDNENRIIYAYKGTDISEILDGIQSVSGGKQTYSVSEYSLTVTSQDGTHSVEYTIDLSIDIPKDAYINSLSIKNGDKELLENFERDKTEYSIRASRDMTTVTINPITNDINANVAVTNNGADFDGTLTEGINNLEITVTSSDNSDIKTYTVVIDTSYLIAEDFSSVSDDKWGFSGGNSACVNVTEVSNASDVEAETLKLLIRNSTASSLTKNLSEDISALKKVNIQFDWRSNMNSDRGRWGYFALQDSSGEYIFSMYANDKNSIGYALTDPTAAGAITNIAEFSRAWYTVSLTLDFESKTIKGTITQKGTDAVTEINTAMNASNLGKMYAYDGYSATPMSIDNIYIR